MINDLVNSILKCEADGARLIDDAKKRAKEMLDNNAAELDKMNAEARTALSKDIADKLEAAEAQAKKRESEEKKQCEESVAAWKKTSDANFNATVKFLEEQLKSLA